jgi:hypothetical protein
MLVTLMTVVSTRIKPCRAAPSENENEQTRCQNRDQKPAAILPC